MTVQDATDIIFTPQRIEVYWLLTTTCGWTVQRRQAWITNTLRTALHRYSHHQARHRKRRQPGESGQRESPVSRSQHTLGGSVRSAERGRRGCLPGVWCLAHAISDRDSE